MNVHPSHCASCGKPLTALQASLGTTCDHLKCKAPVWRQRKQQQEISGLQYRNKMAAQALEQIEVQPLPKLPIVVVPSNQRALCDLPSERIGLFKRHLTELLARARVMLQLPGRKKQLETEFPVYIAEASPTRESVENNACRTCRGDCCTHGGEHAFLSCSDIELRLIRSGESDEEIAQHYLSRLPRHSYEGSCVFHGPSGCTLDRDWRSDTCNSFVCEGLDAALSETARNPPASGDRSCLAVSCDGSQLVRMAHVDAGGERSEREALS